MGDLYDAPNQQAVRPDGSAPWDEGEGGSTGAAPEPQATGLDDMTKDQLLEHAEQNNVKADQSMTKAEIRKAIDKA